MPIKIGLAIIALTSMGSPALANTTRFFSATSCGGNTPSDTNLLARTQQGCFNYYLGPPINAGPNACGPSVTMALPITGNNSDTVDFDAITVNFTNGSTSEVILCGVYIQTSADTIFASMPLQATRASDLTKGVSGALTWTGTVLPNAGGPISGVKAQNIFCVVPSKRPSMSEGSCFESTFSFIMNYMVNTVQP